MIKEKIFMLRNKQVILDKDLAELYEVDTKVLNQAVKRNKERFPEDFMFQLSRKEKDYLVTNCDHLNSLKYSSQLPYVFTEHGVTALAGILKSKKAVEINIKIIRTFVTMIKYIKNNLFISSRIDLLNKKLIEHQIKTDEKFDIIFDKISKNILECEQGIFLDGQIFDAYVFVNKLIESAKKEIKLYDNYVDFSTFLLFSNTKAKVKIYTKITKKLILDLEKYEGDNIELINFTKSHDRFLIIDDNVYHFGASLKDLGKKSFAFSKMKNINLEDFHI